MTEKTEQILVYIIKNHPKLPTTSLMKLSYLADLMSIQELGSQISDFEYIRYNYGPFDKKIYEYIECLVSDGTISPESKYTPSGDEYIVYSFNEETEKFGFDKISDKEKNIIEDLTEKLKGYGAKTITEITYKTKPMQALGATLGGNEHLNEKLNLFCK